ncbi:MAG TPA: hypothetical protein VF904_01770 [Anaeromyxobacteraceae bacterium]
MTPALTLLVPLLLAQPVGQPPDGGVTEIRIGPSATPTPTPT